MNLPNSPHGPGIGGKARPARQRGVAHGETPGVGVGPGLGGKPTGEAYTLRNRWARFEVLPTSYLTDCFVDMLATQPSGTWNPLAPVSRMRQVCNRRTRPVPSGGGAGLTAARRADPGVWGSVGGSRSGVWRGFG